MASMARSTEEARRASDWLGVGSETWTGVSGAQPWRRRDGREVGEGEVGAGGRRRTRGSGMEEWEAMERVEEGRGSGVSLRERA
ncbi:uncharacterized protein MONOS_17826 [Monocercomonoides exilis]|uniref:uncharacterized protein n=1 Tax=Monocercomonoides exilis TaxID=2049356 RepID=UPI00355A604E|nr:hypothetical protein MONOS_17826 [Monocercomonoides exilis]